MINQDADKIILKNEVSNDKIIIWISQIIDVVTPIFCGQYITNIM